MVYGSYKELQNNLENLKMGVRNKMGDRGGDTGKYNVNIFSIFYTCIIKTCYKIMLCDNYHQYLFKTGNIYN